MIGKHLPPDTISTDPQTSYAACPGCDLLVTINPVDLSHRVICNRCGTTIVRSTRNSIERVLAISSAGLLLFIPAMYLPLMTLTTIGIKVSGNVIQTARHFLTEGYFIVAVMVLLSAIIFPLAKLLCAFLVALQVKRSPQTPWLKPVFRFLSHIDEWGMAEVYLIGILVSLIKIFGMASISFGIGFICFILLVFLSVANTSAIDKTLFWNRIARQDNKRLKRIIGKSFITHHQGPSAVVTAKECGLTRCHDCGLLERRTLAVCPRCNASLHQRKTHSIQRTWALLVAAIIFVIPANMFPIMEVKLLGVPDRSTIMDGIIYFFKDGSYGIGLIIFLASIIVPLFKIVGLSIILFSIQFNKCGYLKQKTRMFRFIEFIGRWSMLDIFVIAVMSVLVDFGFLTSIHTAPGATFFCIVVISTMLAAIVFDPRLLWDNCQSNSQQTLS